MAAVFLIASIEKKIARNCEFYCAISEEVFVRISESFYLVSTDAGSALGGATSSDAVKSDQAGSDKHYGSGFGHGRSAVPLGKGA